MRTAPGMTAVGVAVGCALVASLFARDAFDHWALRLGIPILAAALGLVIAFSIAGAKRG
jgi:hypothetical protein